MATSQALVIWSQVVIGFAHLIMGLFLVLIMRSKKDFSRGIGSVFTAFFVVCGFARLAPVFNLGYVGDIVEGTMIACAALVSIAATITLWPFSQRITRIPSSSTLLNQIGEKDRTLEEKAQAYAALEAQAKKMIQLEEHDRRQKLLIRELNHRVKNTLTVVQAIMRQSMRTARDKLHFAETFEDRLMALSHTHSLLLDTEWGGTTLIDLADRLLAHYGKRFHTSGYDLILTPQAALSLGMALHELATNAIKHGAWRTDGLVEIEVACSETDSHIQLVWRESGGPVVTPPETRSFGSKLLHEGVPRELKGTAHKLFLPGGIIYTLRIPHGVGVILSGRMSPPSAVVGEPAAQTG